MPAKPKRGRPPALPKNDSVLFVKLPKELHRLVEHAAQAEGETLSVWVRRAVRKALASGGEK